MWLSAANIEAVHGFSTRHGGISQTPFDSLNLGGQDDSVQNIAINRQRALQQLSLGDNLLCTLKQVHGIQVKLAKPGAQEGDALVTKEKGLVLAVSIADCYPLLFEDPMNGVIGVAHAGWRGTLGGIAKATVNAMCELGASRDTIRVAFGQGISKERFKVGEEVIQAFLQSGFPSNCFISNHIDLIACNKHVLLQAGIISTNIWAMQRCTFEDDFFSYRQDKGLTGRMWGTICLP